MLPIDVNEFSRVYQQAAGDVMRFVTREKQLLLARHDQTLHPDRHDLGAYLRASEKRYRLLIGMVQRAAPTPVEGPSVLDVGGFLAAFPLALARLGVPATMAEAYRYYQGAFDELRAFVEAEGVRVWDLDLTDSEQALPDERFTLVTNMAMIEHLPDSPKVLMDNLRELVAPGGRLILEAPNIAYWPKRLAALRGRSVHQPLASVYVSELPFVGHHREYTERELREVLEWSGFTPDEVIAYNYSLSLQGPRRQRLRTLLVYMLPTTFRRCREVLMACASPTERRGVPGA